MNILDLPLLTNRMEEEPADGATIIRHDRCLLDRIRTRIPACEGESQWSFFAGNYRAYEEDRKKRPGEEGITPKRIRYQPIARKARSIPDRRDDSLHPGSTGLSLKAGTIILR